MQHVEKHAFINLALLLHCSLLSDESMTMASPSLNEENPEAEQLTLSDYSVRNVRFHSFAHHYGAEEISLSTGGQLKHYLKKQCSTLTLLCFLNGILEKIPLLRCLINYNIRKNLFGDIMAGITVAIMHIPQGKYHRQRLFSILFESISGMAYGVLTTLPPVHGKDREKHVLIFMRFFRSLCFIFSCNYLYDFWNLSTSFDWLV